MSENEPNYLVIDCETIPAQDLMNDLKPTCKLGNIKDPVKIAVKEAEWEENGQIKSMSLDPAMCEIVSLQMYSSTMGEIVSGKGTEINQLARFTEESKRHTIIVGHNIMGFDLPVIKSRLMFNNISGARDFSIKRYSNFPIYDTMAILAEWQPDKWKSLNWWGQRLGFDVHESLGSEVHQMWKEGKLDEIHEYCKKDVMLTKKIYEKIKTIY